MPGFPVHQGIATPELSSLLRVTLSTSPPLEAETSQPGSSLWPGPGEEGSSSRTGLIPGEGPLSSVAGPVPAAAGGHRGPGGDVGRGAVGRGAIQRGVGCPVPARSVPSPPSCLPHPGLPIPGPRRRQPSPQPRRPRRRRALPGSLPKSSPLPSSTGKTVSLRGRGPGTPPMGCAAEPPASPLHPSCLPLPQDSSVLRAPPGLFYKTLSLLCPTRWLPATQKLATVAPGLLFSPHLNISGHT